MTINSSGVELRAGGARKEGGVTQIERWRGESSTERGRDWQLTRCVREKRSRLKRTGFSILVT